MNWGTTRVLVTGGRGFVGSHLVDRLRLLGCEPVVPSRAIYDLTDQACVKLMLDQPYDIVFHLAADVGGIEYNKNNPAGVFYNNLRMGMNVIHQAAVSGNVGKLVVMGSACSYPKHTNYPVVEDVLWEGYPEESNGAYGVAKRVLHTMLTAYHEQYGLNGIYPIFANMYGPGDDFVSENAHVIPSLVRKFFTDNPVVIWGSGSATRDFLYVDDAVDALLLLAERYEDISPINIGNGTEHSIHMLVELVKVLAAYRGRVEWNSSKPDGQPRRILRTWKAASELGWKAKTDLIEGLERTISWYVEHYPSHSDDK